MQPSLHSLPWRQATNGRAAIRAVVGVFAAAGAAALTGCGGPPEADPAADGTDYTACEDGECEVAVAEPMDIVIGAPDEGMVTLSITAVTEDGIEYEVIQGGTTSGGSLGGVCQATISETWSSSSCFEEGTPPEPEPLRGELVMQLLGMNDGSAVLRLAVN
jgi:hypothetical protein